MLADSVLKNIALTGQNIRRTYQRTLPSNPNQDYYFIHRNTGTTEPIIVEYGFIDDTSSNLAFLNNNYQELAEAVIKSILEYKNITYMPPTISAQNTYTVQKGDTLYAIAKKYNTTVDQLKKLNQLTTNNISISQVLTIPTQPQNTYTVKAGDTLYNIANQNNTTVDNLKNLNNLNNNTLSIGQVLKLPPTKIIEIPDTTTTHIVQKGDTLYSIAKKYNTTVTQLKELNNLTNNLLSTGQILKIPTTEQIEIPTTTITYTVMPGDTLYSISREYQTTVNNIKEKNNLSTNLLVVGQKLLIPR